MKRQIRRSCFETNSSSTHSVTCSICVCSEETYENWKKGNLLFNVNTEEFIETLKFKLSDKEKEEVVKNYNSKKQKYWKEWEELSNKEKEELYNEAIDKKIQYSHYKTYSTYSSWYEDIFEKKHTTPSGDRIVCFGNCTVSEEYY